MVSEILNNNIKPCTLEYMDKTAIQTVSGYMSNPLPEDTEALLIVEIDGDEAAVANQAELFRSFVRDKDEFVLRQADVPDSTGHKNY